MASDLRMNSIFIIEKYRASQFVQANQRGENDSNSIIIQVNSILCHICISGVFYLLIVCMDGFPKIWVLINFVRLDVARVCMKPTMTTQDVIIDLWYIGWLRLF